jgi:outer membrane protein
MMPAASRCPRVRGSHNGVDRLDVNTLGLKTPDYAPETHYHQLRDAWKGVRTPSGQ